jgi:peptidoglycan/LPS O-acetylase OafA/YrhL
MPRSASGASARVSELDSVRGVAAFVVLLHHLWETILPDQNTFPLQGFAGFGHDRLEDIAFWISVTPLRLLFCGHAAVGVFFVLSGFALMKSLEGPSRQGYLPFVVRRILRIYPPFALVILVAALASWLIRPEAIPGRDWINEYWLTPVTPGLVLGHLGMIATGGYYTSLNSSMWTLVHEMRVSLVFPLLAAFAVRAPRRTLAAALAVFAVLSINHLTAAATAPIPWPALKTAVLSIFQSLRYCLFFVFGILLATRPAFLRLPPINRPWLRAVVWAVPFVLLMIPYTAGYVELCYAIGAVMLLDLCMRSPTARGLLRHSSLLWLGRVSYSLYLTHLVVLIAAVYLLHNLLPIAAILALVVVLALIAAELLNRTVELPSTALGKRLAKRLR